MSRPREELRRILVRPRARLVAEVQQAIAAVRSPGLLRVLTGIKRAASDRPATPREVALVQAVLLSTDRDAPGRCRTATSAADQRSDKDVGGSHCIRCGAGSNLVATVLAGFSCCDTCWRIVSELFGERKLDVDIGRFALPIGGGAIGDLDGIELF